MHRISIAHDKHTSTTWELTPGTPPLIYASTNGDGEWVSPFQAFEQIAETLTNEHYPFPIVTAEVETP